MDNQNNPYQNNQNQSNPYPNGQCPNGQYSNNQYQGNQYQNNQYQNNPYPNNQYQANQYQSNQYPNNQYQNPQDQTTKTEDPQSRKKANTLCWISLGCAITGIIFIPVIMAITEGLFIAPDGASDFVREMTATAYMIPSSFAGMLQIAALVFMIIARIKYPKNTFAKVLMWIYIVAIVIYVILIMIAIATCFYIINQCTP